MILGLFYKMPVPVSPCKVESSQDASTGIPFTSTEALQETACVPTDTYSSQHKEELMDPDVVAGYQDCLKETIRFLLEEEQLSMDHPVVMGLAAHLTREHAHVELSKLSEELTSAVVACSSSPSAVRDILPDQNMHVAPQRTFSAGYEVTLIEDDDEENESMDETECEAESMEDFSDCETELDDYSDSEEAQVREAIMGDPELRRQLLRFVYQGCDLFAAPQAVSELQQSLALQH